ncbi:MAG: hypothetical protein JSV33_16095 [bacterium]|nr:MAG: hypothetical protein JSV33_16095 [bacterium]
MKAFSTITLVTIFAVVLIAAPQSNGLVKYFVIQYPSISPNDDGVRDESPVEIGIVEGLVDTLLLTLHDSLMTQVLDTLLFVPNPPDTEYTVTWDGTDLLGLPLGEDLYRMQLAVSGAETTERYFSNVIVDITTPLVQLDRITPGVFTPGVEGTPDKVLVYYIMSDSREGDSLTVTVTDPDDQAEEQPVGWAGNGNFSIEWTTGIEATDGIYTVSLHVEDEAGNTSGDEGFIDVDTEGPLLDFITTIPPYTVAVPPVVTGYCYDRNGIGAPELVWESTDTFPPDNTYWQNDTLIWESNIEDRVKDGGEYIEGSYTLQVLCADDYGRESQLTLTFTIDLTPPPAPTLAQPPLWVYEPSVEIEITFDIDETDSITIYRAYQGDTTSITRRFGISPFPYLADLEVAYPPAAARSSPAYNVVPAIPNFFWAETLDRAGNRSVPSNTVHVIYDNSSGFYYPESFRGPDVFQIRTATEASRVDIVIFTINGERVARLSETGPSTSFDVEWNLLNDDGKEVRNGPYLVVITVDYNGSKAIEKNFIAVVR